MSDSEQARTGTSAGIQSALAEAERAGFDLSLIDTSLRYTYDKRALQHQAALDLVTELRRAGREPRGGA